MRYIECRNIVLFIRIALPLVILICISSSIYAANDIAAFKWGIKNCTHVKGQGYILHLDSVNGIFKSQGAPKEIYPGHVKTFILNNNGEIEYKTKDGAYLNFTYVRSPLSFAFHYKWNNVWFQSVSPIACGFPARDYNSSICYVALDFPYDPAQCSE